MTHQYGVFVTGCTGFVGSYLVRELLKMDCRVFALARARGLESSEQRVKQLIDSLETEQGQSPIHLRNLTVLTGDLHFDNLGLDGGTIGELTGQVHEVWHCAANTSFKDSDARQIRDVNTAGTSRTLRLTQLLGAEKFHHISTAYVCGARDGIVYEHELRVGQTFRNIYEESKCDAEELVQSAIHQHGLDCRIYRLGIVVGDSRTGMATKFSGFYNLARYLYTFSYAVRSDGNTRHWREVLVHQMIRHMGANEIRIPANPSARINLVTIDFVARLLLILGANDDAANRTFHVINPEPPSAEMLFTWTFSFFGLKGFRVTKTADISAFPARNFAVRWLERRMISHMQPYSSYLDEGIYFDNRNVRRILPCDQLRHPLFDYDLVSRLLSVAVESSWGKARST